MALALDIMVLDITGGAKVKTKFGAMLRGVLGVLLGATVTMTLLGAVGTVCIAWSADKYGKALADYVPYMSAYQTLVYIKLVIAVVGIVVTYAFLRAERWSYVGALLTLLAGLGAATAQMYDTSIIRDIPFLAVAPTNIRFYLTSVTLLAFLIVRIPGIWNKCGLSNTTSKPGSPMAAGGVALIVAGLLMLTTPWWVGDTHMLGGYNLVNTLQAPLLIDGTLLVLGGLGMIFARKLMALVSPRPVRSARPHRSSDPSA